MRAAARIQHGLDVNLAVLENEAHVIGAERGTDLDREGDVSGAGNSGALDDALHLLGDGGG
jgi:hypothetical protein